MMKLRGLMKHLHLAVEGLNTTLVEQFETGEEPVVVVERVTRVLVPAIQILQARTHRQPGGRDAAILEEVRAHPTQPVLQKLIICCTCLREAFSQKYVA